MEIPILFNYWLTYGYRESNGFRLSGDFDEESEHTGTGSDYNEDGGRRDLSDYIKKTLNAKIGTVNKIFSENSLSLLQTNPT